MSNGNSINISSGTIIRVFVIGIAFYLLYILRDLALVLFTSITIAASIEPANRVMIKKGVPRVLSVIIIFLTIAIVVSAGFYLFLPTFLNDAIGLLGTLPKYVDSGELWNPLRETAIGGAVSNFSLQEVIKSLSSTFTNVTGGLFTTVSGFFGGIISFILVVVLSFYLSVQNDGVGNFLRIVVPDQYENYVLSLWRRSENKIGLWLQGQLLLAVIIGVLTFLGLSIIGVRSAMFLAAIAAVLEIIPIFGLVLAIIPAMAVALTDGGITLSLVVLGLYIIIQQFEAHLIYPLVVRKIVGIPPILVILTLLVGLKLAGFLGVLLSVPVAAIVVEVLSDLEKKKIPHA